MRLRIVSTGKVKSKKLAENNGISGDMIRIEIESHDEKMLDFLGVSEAEFITAFDTVMGMIEDFRGKALLLMDDELNLIFSEGNERAKNGYMLNM